MTTLTFPAHNSFPDEFTFEIEDRAAMRIPPQEWRKTLDGVKKFLEGCQACGYQVIEWRDEQAMATKFKCRKTHRP